MWGNRQLAIASSQAKINHLVASRSQLTLRALVGLGCMWPWIKQALHNAIKRVCVCIGRANVKVKATNGAQTTRGKCALLMKVSDDR